MTRAIGLALPLLSGSLAALGHAPFSFWPIALLGFGGLIWLVARSDRPGRTAWIGGVGYFAITLHWIVEPFLVDVARHGWMAPFALLFMAAGGALFWALAGWLSAQLAPRALGFAVALAATEMLRGHLLTGFPWALPAYIWTDTSVRLSAALIGPYGLTLVTLVIAALPALTPRPWAGAAVALTAVGLLFVSFPQGAPSGQDLGTVRLVQPNAPQHEKWDPQKAGIFVRRQIDFTSKPKEDVDLIVWPETAIPFRLSRAGPVFERISEVAEGTPVILGINRQESGKNHNAMVTLGPEGVIGKPYDKVHLVPFGEFIPFGELARWIGLRSFAARDGFGFAPGKAVRLIDTPLGQALPLICYEAIFPGHIRRQEKRPDYLLQITNDAWFGTFSGPYQHLDQARFRALEQGLPLVRVANTGISTVVDAYGNLGQSLELGKTGFLDAKVPEGRAITLYGRFGDRPILLLLIVLGGALFWNNRRNAIALDAGNQ